MLVRVLPASALALVAMLALVGCGGPIPVNYAPSSVLSAEGTAQVAQFTYSPSVPSQGKKTARIKANQIRNTAMGNILLEQEIGQLYRDAVFKELRFVGVKVGSQGVIISGDVEEFLADDLGYSVDWTLRVHYVVKDEKGAVLYDAVKSVQRKTDKMANVFGALNEVMKLNIEALITDKAFLEVIAPAAQPRVATSGGVNPS